jgi:putative DNA primase/helicase
MTLNINEAIDPATEIIASKPTPEPLPELPEVTPFYYDFLPAAIRGYVRDISERMQCPPDFAAINTYLMLSAVIGCKIGIKPKRHDGWIVAPNLWGVTIGGSGVMKSPNRSEVLKPLKHFQIELAREVYDRNVQLVNSGEEVKLRQAAKKSQAKKMLKNDPAADISEYLK